MCFGLGSRRISNLRNVNLNFKELQSSSTHLTKHPSTPVKMAAAVSIPISAAPCPHLPSTKAPNFPHQHSHHLPPSLTHLSLPTTVPRRQQARLDQAPLPTRPPRQHRQLAQRLQSPPRRRPAARASPLRRPKGRRLLALPADAEEHGGRRRDRAVLQVLPAQDVRREQAAARDRGVRAGRAQECRGDQGQGGGGVEEFGEGVGRYRGRAALGSDDGG